MRDTRNKSNDFIIVHDVAECTGLSGGLDSGINILASEITERITLAVCQHIFDALVERDHVALITPAVISFATSVSYSDFN